MPHSIPRITPIPTAKIKVLFEATIIVTATTQERLAAGDDATFKALEEQLRLRLEAESLSIGDISRPDE